MLIRKATFCSLVFFISGLTGNFRVHAQQWTVLGGSYIGKYDLGDMKKYQDFNIFLAAATFNVLLQKSEDFPATLGGELIVQQSKGRVSLGLIGWRNSTGSRVDYEDFSASLRHDLSCTVNGLGLRSTYDLLTTPSVKVYGLLHAGAEFNTVSTRNSETPLPPIFPQYLPLDVQFKTTNIVAVPGLGFRYQISGRFVTAIEFRYLYSLSAGQINQKYSIFNGLEVKWDGMRASMLMGYVLGKNK